MAVTIKDVAKKAGVSHTTVSMVLHNDKRITPETKKKVLKAVKELKYYPNYLARGLIGGKTNVIAVITSYFYFSSFFEITALNGMEQSNAAFNNKYVLNQFSTGGSQENRNKLLREILYGRRADAVIGLNIRPSKNVIDEYKRKNVPIVLIDEVIKEVHSVKADNIKGAEIATECLIKKGRKNIALIVGRLEGEGAGIAPKERLEGYKKVLKKYDRNVNNNLIAESINYSFSDGEQLLKELIKRDKTIDAIFCAAGDMTAFGVIKAAKEMGIKIPDDIALIGYDDIVLAPLSEPPLTTIKQPILKMGLEAFNLAVESIEGKIKEVKHLIFDPELIIRGSA